VETDRLFHVNAPAVVSEIIDGEAVIMNLKSGNYFSTEHVGGLLWGWIEQGKTYRQLLEHVRATFAAVPDDMAATVELFISDLIANDLVRETQVDAVQTPPAQIAGAHVNGARGFRAPVLNVYADMKDLLLLDPIHDVDEVGWPTPKQPD
jgi:hypothetical protein